MRSDLVHGGCWLSKLGTYDPRAVAFDNMRPMANALTEDGIATWNIEYRRIDQPGGGRQVFLAGAMFRSQVEPYTAAAKNSGDSIAATHFDKAGHFLFIDPQSEIWPEVVRSVQRALGMAQ